MAAMPSWRMLFEQEMVLAASLARLSAGKSIAANRVMIPITMSNSTRVNAWPRPSALRARKHKNQSHIMDDPLKAISTTYRLPAKSLDRHYIQHSQEICKIGFQLFNPPRLNRRGDRKANAGALELCPLRSTPGALTRRPHLVHNENRARNHWRVSSPMV